LLHVVQGPPRIWGDNFCMLGMDERSKRTHPRNTGLRKRVGGMTANTENGLAAVDGGDQARRVVARELEGCGVVARPRANFVVITQNIQLIILDSVHPVILAGIAIPTPAGGRPGGRL